MKPFTTLTSTVVPVAIKDVDTDMIIPAQYLTSVSKGGYGQHVFERLYQADQDFSFHQPRYKGAEILVSESNFGCGSSREHAVWALQEAGIKVIIAMSFSDIFFNNAAKNGLLLVQLPAEIVRVWITQSQQVDWILSVDLAMQTVSEQSGPSYHFDYDPFRRHCLLNGQDDLDYLHAHRAQIDLHFQGRL